MSNLDGVQELTSSQPKSHKSLLNNFCTELDNNFIKAENGICYAAL